MHMHNAIWVRERWLCKLLIVVLGIQTACGIQIDVCTFSCYLQCRKVEDKEIMTRYTYVFTFAQFCFQRGPLISKHIFVIKYIDFPV